MIDLKDFENAGLSITWKLVDIGFNSDTAFSNLLSVSVILQYAYDEFSKGCTDTDINYLLFTDETDLWDIDKSIKILAAKENSSYETELRKWRIFYVLKNLPSFNADCVQGLIALGDIWAFLGFPKDSPHTFQGRNNSITLGQYYTSDNFNDLLWKHIRWLKDEMHQIQLAP